MQATRTMVLMFSVWLIGAATTRAQAPAPDPMHMSNEQLQAEVRRLRALTDNGAVTAQRPAGCNNAEQRQFDFWLGEWDVSETGSAATEAESSITLHDQGCVILEYWRPFQGASGHSINGYDSDAKLWRQTWIDATGRITAYGGAMRDGTLYLDNLSPPAMGAAAGKRRMNFRAVNANTVRQWGESFDEKSGKWSVAWDLTYHRRANTRY